MIFRLASLNNSNNLGPKLFGPIKGKACWATYNSPICLSAMDLGAPSRECPRCNALCISLLVEVVAQK
ncbi:AR2 [Sida golden mosaic Florida virus-USA]|uniref:AR2 n=1 Tax=Sida golden mosaic Florida virus-USA TaxID=223315 RepID=Q9YNX0_9GEMI|nr:AR2 [Sida golden mosaic Florida virus-USA]